MVISSSALDAHRAWLETGGAGAGARLVVMGVDARGADLTRRDLTSCVAERSSFDGAAFAGSTLARARVTGSSFRAAVLGDATLDDAVFVECDFRDADFSVVAGQRMGGAGTTARCRFDRCDLRGTVWLDRDLSSAVFVECQFDLAAGIPRSTTDVLIARPLLAIGEDAAHEVAADQILAMWQVGRPQPPLTDDDKAFIHKGLLGRWRKREERIARGPRPPAAAGVGTFADKWSGDFLRADPAPAAAMVLPAVTPRGISAVVGTSGIALYRDARSRFSMALPSPLFLDPSPEMDATCGVAGAVLHVCRVPRRTDGNAIDAVLGLVRDVSGAAPHVVTPGPGVIAAAAGFGRRGDAVRQVAAFAGGAGDEAATILLMFDYGASQLDAVTALTVWSAIVGSASFGEPGRQPPVSLVPGSPWLASGLPIRSASSRPALPRLTYAPGLAAALMGVSELLAPSRTLDTGTRAELTRRLDAAGAAGADALVASLATVHDLRGLALAIASQDAGALDPRSVEHREPLSDRRWRGRDAGGRAVLVAEAPPLRHDVAVVEAMLRMDVPGITALRYLGPGLESGAMCIEDEPAGTPLTRLVGTLGVRDAARVGAALAAVVARAHARGIVLGGIRLETTGWSADDQTCEIAPRFVPFWRSCAEPSSGRGWPEQLACESPEVSAGRQATLPSDVYSVALATAWLVHPSAAGGPPLDGVLQMQWMQILSGEPRIAPALTAALRPALVRAPEMRCSISELRDALLAV
jgi:hypothetical protein